MSKVPLDSPRQFEVPLKVYVEFSSEEIWKNQKKIYPQIIHTLNLAEKKIKFESDKDELFQEVNQVVKVDCTWETTYKILKHFLITSP